MKALLAQNEMRSPLWLEKLNHSQVKLISACNTFNYVHSGLKTSTLKAFSAKPFFLSTPVPHKTRMHEERQEHCNKCAFSPPEECTWFLSNTFLRVFVVTLKKMADGGWILLPLPTPHIHTRSTLLPQGSVMGFLPHQLFSLVQHFFSKYKSLRLCLHSFLWGRNSIRRIYLFVIFISHLLWPYCHLSVANNILNNTKCNNTVKTIQNSIKYTHQPDLKD